MAGQNGATAAELQARAGHASRAAMEICRQAILERDQLFAEKIGQSVRRLARVHARTDAG